MADNDKPVGIDAQFQRHLDEGRFMIQRSRSSGRTVGASRSSPLNSYASPTGRRGWKSYGRPLRHSLARSARAVEGSTVVDASCSCCGIDTLEVNFQKIVFSGDGGMLMPREGSRDIARWVSRFPIRTCLDGWVNRGADVKHGLSIRAVATGATDSVSAKGARLPRVQLPRPWRLMTAMASNGYSVGKTRWPLHGLPVVRRPLRYTLTEMVHGPFRAKHPARMPRST